MIFMENYSINIPFSMENFISLFRAYKLYRAYKFFRALTKSISHSNVDKKMHSTPYLKKNNKTPMLDKSRLKP